MCSFFGIADPEELVRLYSCQWRLKTAFTLQGFVGFSPAECWCSCNCGMVVLFYHWFGCCMLHYVKKAAKKYMNTVCLLSCLQQICANSSICSYPQTKKNNILKSARGSALTIHSLNALEPARSARMKLLFPQSPWLSGTVLGELRLCVILALCTNLGVQPHVRCGRTLYQLGEIMHITQSTSCLE